MGDVTVDVYAEGDLSERTLYPPGMAVTLLLHNNIVLQKPLVLGPKFSCTKFLSALPRARSSSPTPGTVLCSTVQCGAAVQCSAVQPCTAQ